MDNRKFPGVERARECLEGANGAPAVLNAANEVAVELFLNKATPFESINVLVGEALSVFGDRNYSSIEELFALTEEVAGWTRQYAVGIRKCG
jgi:1-deoxy-D-xylulose-5-phosphate reductoisomerase